MKGIQIKIKGQWIYLPADFSINLEQTSPVFNDQGIFSFPFEIPLEPNRSLFKNIADPFGDIRLSDLDKSPTEVWFGGVMLYRGIIELDDEVEFDTDDSIPVTFLSGNSDLMSRIEGINARDVPLDREIELGYVVESAFTIINDPKYNIFTTLYFGKEVMKYKTNVSDPYPIKPYCNTRICMPADKGGYKILEAARPYSGTCFYVLYLFECLFKKLGIKLEIEKLKRIDDMCRLAFFTTQCDCEPKGEPFSVKWSEIAQPDVLGDFELNMRYHYESRDKGGNVTRNYKREDFAYSARKVYATNKNFPDVEVKKILDDMSNVFGVIFLYHNESNMVEVVYKKDVFASTETLVLDVEILRIEMVRNKYAGLRLTYGNEKDTAFNYNDYSKLVKENGYLDILRYGTASNDTNCYYDTKTGNAYRVKVDKQTGMNPALIEVGGFNDYTIEGVDNGNMQSININFSPVLINDVTNKVLELASSGKEYQQTLAVFVEQELLSENKVEQKCLPSLRGIKLENLKRTTIEAVLKYETQENYDRSNGNESPLRTYDAGYTLGIMRGPGNDSGLEIDDINYDKEGNSSWVQTVGGYSFTSDSCDNFGRFFDYNGTEAGGVDQKGRFSLKLIADKDNLPIDALYKDRGLVSKFLSEYLYFIARKKTIIITAKMNITQIINIDFLKRYKIGDYVGFINKISYTLGVEGNLEATIELYTL